MLMSPIKYNHSVPSPPFMGERTRVGGKVLIFHDPHEWGGKITDWLARI